ncbi:hypothetical protein SAMN06296378_0945 [Salinibacterium xinjiangense]|uniref:Uncharacterized protein n=1 Tax=Salinibacterium xinjiangense TaxID=386302 RepID=A0A2C8Z6T7_9MICO|nr:hypothetical protein SAMN06296378_0945 [Salinibacterium xinjiangense]
MRQTQTQTENTNTNTNTGIASASATTSRSPKGRSHELNPTMPNIAKHCQDTDDRARFS